MRRIITSGACAATALLGYTTYKEPVEKPSPAPAPLAPQTALATPAVAVPIQVSSPPAETPISVFAPRSRSSQASSTAKSTTPLSRTELKRRAVTVEKEANRELDRLVRTLGLSEEQQDYVFAALAQTSPLYGDAMHIDPGNPAAIAVSGLAASSGIPREEVIYEILDPEQQDAYTEDILEQASDTDAWWKELIEEVEDSISEETPVIPTVPEIPAEVISQEPAEDKIKDVTEFVFPTS